MKISGLTYLIIMFLIATGVLLIVPQLLSNTFGDIGTALIVVAIILGAWGCIMYYNNNGDSTI